MLHRPSQISENAGLTALDIAKLAFRVGELERRNAELERECEELRFVFDATPARIWYKDDANTILNLNASAARSMGATVEQARGRDTRELFTDTATEQLSDDLAVIDSGKPRLGDVERYLPARGKGGWARTDKLPLANRRLLVVSTDVTEFVEQRAKLQSINKNLDDFASLASHDLQTPLRHIALFTELLTEHSRNAMDEQARDWLSHISDGVVEMRTLIETFLRFMRESPSEFVMRDVDVRAVVDAALHRIGPEAAGKIATLDVPETGTTVRGDPFLLVQVFSNIIGNAIKYRARDRQMKLCIQTTKHRGQVHISFEDNGIGVDAEQVDSVFDLFARAKCAGGDTSGAKGTGVGLALCRRIIVHHGGTIGLKPAREHPVGSRFTVKLTPGEGDAS